MKKHYDFSKARPNPYAKLLQQSVTIRVDTATVAYFKALAADADLPYQTLIRLYLRDCAASERRLDLKWRKGERVRHEMGLASLGVLIQR